MSQPSMQEEVLNRLEPEKDEGGEAVSLFPLLAARRRENHLWHSGDSFVTLTVMLLCAGLTHRMNP